MHQIAANAKKFALFLLALLAAAPAPSADPAAVPARVVAGEAGEAMHRLLERSEAFGWSGQVLVAGGGEVLLHEAYGHAHRGTQAPMTPETRIGIASLSKQLTAAAVLALRDAGRLALDDPLSRFLPAVGPELAPVTLHQLLAHTAGLPPGDPVGDDFEIESGEALLRALGELQPVGPSGERWRYANVGYNLLAAVVEAAAGTPYERFVVERLFERAGMDHSGFWHLPRAGRGEVAHAYRAWVDQGSPLDWPRNWRVYGSGDVLSTAADLYRWELALRAGKVLSPESVELLRTPHVSVRETGDSYGYGWFLHPLEKGGGYVAEHGGDWLGGYNAFHYVDPGEELVVIVTSNATDASGMWLRQAVQKSLIDLATGDEPVELPPPAELAPAPAELAGTYVLPGGGELHAFSDGAHVWLAAEGQTAGNLLLRADGDTAAGLGRATERTWALFAGLLAAEEGQASAAFLRALGEEGRPHLDGYVSEWRGLLDRHGRLRSYRVLGARPFHGSASSAVRLRFARASVVMTCLWSEGGEGRLHGTLVRDRPGSPLPLPAAYPVAPSGEERYVAWDVFGGHGLEIEVALRNGVRTLLLRPLGGGEPVEAQALEGLVPTVAGWERPKP